MGFLDDLRRRLRREGIAGIEQRELQEFVEELRRTLQAHSHADWLVMAVKYRYQERPSGTMDWFPASSVAMTDNSEHHLEIAIGLSRERDSSDPNSVTRTEYEWARKGGEWTEWAKEVLNLSRR